ncbi:MAG: hypothetical protein ABL971_16475 [Vicinamibacterales bacterium]
MLEEAVQAVFIGSEGDDGPVDDVVGGKVEITPPSITVPAIDGLFEGVSREPVIHPARAYTSHGSSEDAQAFEQRGVNPTTLRSDHGLFYHSDNAAARLRREADSGDEACGTTMLALELAIR